MPCPASIVILLQQVPTYVILPWDKKIIPLDVEQTILFQKASLFLSGRGSPLSLPQQA
jgi:hypothetical protein